MSKYQVDGEPSNESAVNLLFEAVKAINIRLDAMDKKFEDIILFQHGVLGEYDLLDLKIKDLRKEMLNTIGETLSPGNIVPDLIFSIPPDSKRFKFDFDQGSWMYNADPETENWYEIEFNYPEASAVAAAEWMQVYFTKGWEQTDMGLVEKEGYDPTVQEALDFARGWLNVGGFLHDNKR